MIAGLGSSVVSARALGAEGRGQYYAVITLAAIVAQFGNLGISSSNTFIASRGPSKVPRLLGNSLFISLACLLGGGCMAGAAAFLFGQRPAMELPMMLTAAALAPCILFIALGGGLLVAEERFNAVNGWQLFNAATAIAVLLTCALLKARPIAYALGTTGAAVATVLGMWVSLTRRRHVAFGFDFGLFRESFAFAARAYMAVLAGFLMQRAAATVLLAHGEVRGLGLFSVSAQIYDVLLILPSSVGLVLFPTLIKHSANAWSATREALLVTMGAMALASVGAIAFGHALLPLVFGSPFEGSYAPLVALLPGVLCISAVSVLSQFLVSQAFPLSLVMIWIAGFAITACAAALLYAMYGTVGVAAAQSIGSASVLIGVIALTARRLKSGHESDLRAERTCTPR